MRNSHQYPHPDQVKVAVLADSLQHESEARLSLLDLWLAGAAIALGLAGFLALH
ncbi:MAG TPA: hypothetical protein V6D02_10445 [Candidatus Obscuribacterales bacterium]